MAHKEPSIRGARFQLQYRCKRLQAGVVLLCMLLVTLAAQAEEYRLTDKVLMCGNRKMIAEVQAKLRNFMSFDELLALAKSRGYELNVDMSSNADGSMYPLLNVLKVSRDGDSAFACFYWRPQPGGEEFEAQQLGCHVVLTAQLYDSRNEGPDLAKLRAQAASLTV
jgi:hypothetical protein